MRRLIVASATR